MKKTKAAEETLKQHRSLLEEKVESQTEQLREAYGHLDVLLRNTIQMTSTLDVQKVMIMTVNGLVNGSQAALARIWLLGPGDICDECFNASICKNRDHCLHLNASAGLSTNLEGNFRRMPFGTTKIGMIALNRKADCIADALKDHETVEKDWVQQNGLKSFAGYPLVFKDELMGVLAMFSRRRFSEEEFERLGVFANQGAIAIKNAQLFKEVKTLKDRLEAENIYLQSEIKLRHNFEEIIGRSTPLKKTLRKVEQVAATDTSVLIFGETGTGKELIARAIHSLSNRKNRPLVKVDCGAISAGLVESELFGHEKGAFTGAQDQHIGRFEVADGGTLFLDEIGELPLETQVKLLRVLQDQAFERVGGSHTISVDVRIIAATNRDLAAAVEQGKFRSDLFYRINVFPIEIPPLRERKKDIPLLLNYFLGKFSREHGKAFDGILPESIEKLSGYAWPGNVRELQNVVERAIIVAQGPVLRFDSFHNTRHESSLPIPMSGTLEEMARDYIRQILDKTGWVIDGPGGAALILGLHPNTLRTRMKKLGIKRPGSRG